MQCYNDCFKIRLCVPHVSVISFACFEIRSLFQVLVLFFSVPSPLSQTLPWQLAVSRDTIFIRY